ncbi:2Fe-2S iron-sulfur cluster-binding protein [Butyrivibrio sp. LC3010]|uniref:2Fe-2S iron-sulfur cluster-binding protein n=1 Tax=Butyrivibrio sp. LC3010 TaxID=1280680 RepID=UPI00042672CB|nr:2Fe-2S iron-sulfur cluster-binding protein [Butyrivibrio sp. LC3010]
MKIKILRQKTPETNPYWECFEYNGTKEISVAGMLDQLNFGDDILNDQGLKTDRIGWDCSCLQGVCGACAMVINEVPALACETFLKNLKGETVTLRPLRKFPVIHDLIVDRSIIHENLKITDIYIGEYNPKADEDHDLQYTAAKCLKCGLCLEVCPNYTVGKSFFGAVYANDCYLVHERNTNKAKDIHVSYAKHFGNACSKALSCMEVCPVHISSLASMSKLNRV